MAIVNHIEKHEAFRISDWKHIEDMVLETALRVMGEKGVGKSTRASHEQWYCRTITSLKAAQKIAPMMPKLEEGADMSDTSVPDVGQWIKR